MKDVRIVVFLVTLTWALTPLVAAEAGINNPSSTIAACAAAAPPQPVLIKDAIKAANQWRQKRLFAANKSAKSAKEELDAYGAFISFQPILSADVLMVGNFPAFFRCIGAGNDLAGEAARNQRYSVLGSADPILLNYNEEMISLIGDYERSWVPGQGFSGGNSPRYLRDVVSSWILAASDLRAGKPLSVALQTEYLYLRKVGIKPTDPNLRLLARRIAETAKAEMLGSQKAVQVNIAPAAILTAAR